MINKAKRLVKILLNSLLMDLNEYPKLHYLNSPLKKKISFSPKNRISFWTKIAKSYPAFQPFYDKNSVHLYLKKKNIHQDHWFFKNLKQLYEEGYTSIDNFLDIHQRNQILNLFDKQINNKQFNQSKTITSEINDHEINKMFHSKISKIENIIFDKQLKPQKYRLHQITICNQNPPYVPSNNFHQDKFIPSFKLFYFPERVKTNPLEILKGSHFIENQYLANSLLSSTNMAGSGSWYKNLDFSNYENKRFYAKENSLLIAATHAFHRRYPEKINGVRKSIVVSYYDQFNAFDLIKNYVSKKLRLI